ncbi:hypothetical protein GCM10007939_11470 [Amylibacter marinus]|uniref:DUF1330 domain-containing protein n=1 Tax=Amylibacter marinus TaxID=1475483 RepID=A0ABQ5VUQ5_9RHOB|nr:DUF1330 domain-containing protein [Amylibacter marinus]GLQ34864.1 hypothetical protein GCM10007939_11470 [Amylibacter marinus]
MIYAYANLTITNPEALKQYQEVSVPALAKHGGLIVSATREFTVLDGDPDIPVVAALLSFPNKQSAENWATDEALSDVHALRRSAGASNIILLG